jgi:epoxyqueuosine reductase
MRLLLHTCCAPCLEYPSDVLKKESISFSPLFYNPNIQPFWEYQRRKQGLKKLASLKGIEVFYISPDDNKLESTIESYQKLWAEKSDTQRCANCYRVRLRETALNAKKHGYNYFSTTLLLSIYQNHNLIKKLGEIIEDELNGEVRFYYKDFRDGFRKSQAMAKEDQLYRQKFCGCICSLNQSPYRDKIYYQARKHISIVNPYDSL